MALSDIVNLTISKETAAVSRASFGTILIAAYHNNFTGIQEYTASSALADLVSDGFSSSSPTYKIATRLLSQSPRISKFKVGTLSTSWNQTLKIRPTASNDKVYSGVLNGLAWTFTADSSATLAEVCTGIASAIDALAGVTATSTDTGTTVTVVVTANETIMNFSAPTGDGVYTIEDITDDTAIDTDLAALRAADSDWYGLLIDRVSHDANLTAATWAETDRAVFAASSADYLFDSSSVYDDMHALSFARSGLWYHPDADAFVGAGVMGAVFPYDPGAATWKFKTLAGISIPTVAQQNATTKSALKAFKANYYESVGGVGMTTEGVTASGEFYDITQGIDYVHARMTENVFALLKSAPKLPYEDVSGDRIRSVMDGVLKDAQDKTILARDPAPVISIPTVASQQTADRNARFFPGITFSARLSGAIHAVDIDGQVNV
jgi:hypothetical protein